MFQDHDIEMLEDNTYTDRQQKILALLERPFPKDITFENILGQYASFYNELGPAQKTQMSELFWDKVKRIGTPIIEEIDDVSVRVHFLFPQDNYKHDSKKLYVAGDYHGFISTNNKRQEMFHIEGTNIMHRSDVMAKDSVVTYHYIQIDSVFADKDRPYFSGPSEALPLSFFPEILTPDNFTPPLTTRGTEPFAEQEVYLPDEFSKHQHVPMSFSPMFCANADNDISHLDLSPINWSQLLTADSGHHPSLITLNHKATYLCDHSDKLSVDTNIDDGYTDKLLKDPDHSRAVSVFEPTSGKVEHVIIVSDGTGYMATNAVARIDKLMQDQQIPANTAIVFVTTLPGLLNKYGLSKDKNARAVEFGDRVDDYVRFIDHELLYELGYDKVQKSNITLIGASMSATASLFMALEHEDKFGKVIAQAPSYSNRKILNSAVSKRVIDKQSEKAKDLSERVQLSCGIFDSLEHAQNLNLAHTEQLASILGDNAGNRLPVYTGNYGHLIPCWSQELTTALPNFYRNKSEVSEGSSVAGSHYYSATSQSSFTPSFFAAKHKSNSLPDLNKLHEHITIRI